MSIYMSFYPSISCLSARSRTTRAMRAGRLEVGEGGLDELGEVVRDVAVRRAAEVVVVGVLREAAVVERPREVVDDVLHMLFIKKRAISSNTQS